MIGGFMMPKINLPGTPYNRALKAWNTAKKQLAEIVAIRRRTTDFRETATNSSNCNGFRDSLASLLVGIRESGEEMSDVEIADRLIIVLVSIHDTSSATITMIFKYLGKHPEVYDVVLQESREVAARKTTGEVYLNWEDIQNMKYTWNVSREVMRFCPLVQLLTREALTDFSYAGFHIPEGWKVVLSINEAHMDPKYFTDPHKFDPTRFEGNEPLPNTYIPFGGGHNICPGKNFAQALVLVFLHKVVTRFKWELLLDDSDDQVLIDPIPRPTTGIPVRLYQHPICVNL